MPSSKKRPKKTFKKPTPRPFPWLAVGLPAAVFLVVIIASFGFAASMEEKDTFCSSCHTQPESTFYQRSLDRKVTDLASFHRTQDTKCIDCHSGVGITGRVGAILLGSRNALAYFTRTAQQPAPLTVPIADANCIKCHEQVTSGQPTMDNHFHIFLIRWQAADPNASGCVSCHSGHNPAGEGQYGYLDPQQTDQVCQSCHEKLREGG